MLFSELDLHDDLKKGLADNDYVEATPIQTEVLPIYQKGKDVIACAKTGSGKTLAFLIPMIESFLKVEAEDAPRGLILAPTRELAMQINAEFEKVSKNLALTSVVLYGGTGYEEQKKAIKEKPDLIIATPGRLIDLFKSKEVILSKVNFIVLDEADRMLDMGFIEDVKFILSKTNKERHVSLFSATLDYNIFYSVFEYMSDPEEILINPEVIDHNTIDQEVTHLGRDEKVAYLIGYLSKFDFNPVIIFTNTRNFVENLAHNLSRYDIPAQGLSSVINQTKRIKILEQFKNKKFRVLVATDVASRGLHIDDVALVINFDLPQDPESYVHRIGRTARAGRTGRALSLCSEMDYSELGKIEKMLDYKIPSVDPDDDVMNRLEVYSIREVRQKREYNDNRGRDNGNKRNNNRQSSRSDSRSNQRDDNRKDNRSNRNNDRYKGKGRDNSHGRRDRENGQDDFKFKPDKVSWQDVPDYPASSSESKKTGLFKKLKNLFSSKKEKPKAKTESKTEGRGQGQGHNRSQATKSHSSNKKRNHNRPRNNNRRYQNKGKNSSHNNKSKVSK